MKKHRSYYHNQILFQICSTSMGAQMVVNFKEGSILFDFKSDMAACHPRWGGGGEGGRKIGGFKRVRPPTWPSRNKPWIDYTTVLHEHRESLSLSQDFLSCFHSDHRHPMATFLLYMSTLYMCNYLVDPAAQKLSSRQKLALCPSATIAPVVMLSKS